MPDDCQNRSSTESLRRLLNRTLAAHMFDGRFSRMSSLCRIGIIDRSEVGARFVTAAGGHSGWAGVTNSSPESDVIVLCRTIGLTGFCGDDMLGLHD